MNDTNERLLDLIERQQIMIDILWAYVDEKYILEIMGLVAQEIREQTVPSDD